MMEGFLLGVIVTGWLVSGAFFLKFWKHTRDLFFLGFGAALVIEGLNRASYLFSDNSEGGGDVNYVVRLASYLLILASIAYKNRP